jgi:predicted permease
MSRKDRELDEEIQAHLDMAARDRIDRGASPADAAADARREFGNVALVKEVTRGMWSGRWLEPLLQDLRYGARLLRRSPGFAAVGVLSLALGIGANTAIFQVINAVRLRMLAVSHPEILAEIRIADMNGARGNFNSRYPSVTNPIWEQVRADQQAFAGVLAWNGTDFNLAPGGVARPARGLFVSGSFFEVLGVRAADGRLLAPADDVRGCPLRAVVSHGFWQRESGGQPVSSRTRLLLEGESAEVIGVSEPGFHGVEVGRAFDVAVPICAQPLVSSRDRLASATEWWLALMGRLKPGWTFDQASAHLAGISPGIFRATLPPNYPAVSVDRYRAFTLRALPGGRGASGLRQDYETPLWLLLGTAGLVLIIACVNLANLMLARASAREREFAVRLGLGASRGRVFRQLLVESLLLAVLGAVSGTVLAGFLSRALVAYFDTGDQSVFLDLTMDWRVLAFTAGAAVLTCLLFGLAPALRATRTGSGGLLRGGGRGLTGSRDRLVLRRVLVTVQVALSLLLVVGAILFTRTLMNLHRVDPGFNTDGVVIASLDMRAAGVAREAEHTLHAEILRRLRDVPGVRATAEAAIVPLSGDSWGNDVWIQGTDPGRAAQVLFNRVSEGFLSTLGIPLIAGRNFGEADTLSSPRVAIVNETFVRAFVSGNAVGQRFNVEPTPGNPEVRTYEIAGVVRDSKYTDLRQEPTPVAFLPTGQGSRGGEYARIVVRCDLPPAPLASAMAQAIGEVHPGIVVSFTNWSAQIHDTLLRERLMATLSGFFGGIAALLAVIGLYGVIAYGAARRRKEIGIRIALGAGRAEVLRTIMNEALLLIAVGIAGGATLVLACGGLAGTLLFGLEAGDSATIGAAAATLGAVALLASYLPARAAARIEPMVALRDE